MRIEAIRKVKFRGREIERGEIFYWSKIEEM